MKTSYDHATILNELSGKGKGSIGHTAAKSYLRHTHPVLGVDRIQDHHFEEGWLHAVRAISCSMPVFQGHFPDSAIYPGTNLLQDIVQLAIILFIGSTGKLNTDPESQEISVVTNMSANMGHPVAPGNLLDIALWTVEKQGNRGTLFGYEARVRDFPFYTAPNRFGIKFDAAIKGQCELKRIKRKMYEGIEF